MIGVIGPEDSLQLVQEAARGEGLDPSRVAARAYGRLEEAVTIARNLDASCQVLMFTGIVPYTLVKNSLEIQARMEYIPHSTTDLYRVLVRILRASEGVVPTLTVDTIDRDTIEDACADLDLAEDRLLPLDVSSAELLYEAHRVAAAHAEAYESGRTMGALTCLHSVDEYLKTRDIPCWRIDHSPSTIRATLREVQLAERVEQSVGMQTAEGLIEIPALSSDSEDGGDESLRSRVEKRLSEYADGLRGTLAIRNESTFVLHTTRAMIENGLERLRRNQKSVLIPSGLDERAFIGLGLGFNVSTAAQRASRALDASRSSGEIHVVFEDDSVLNVSDIRGVPATKPTTQEDKGPVGQELAQIGLGNLAVDRLVAALGRLDCRAVSATDLAEAYGVGNRSARRMLSALEEASVAVLVRSKNPSGLGRPPKTYKINLDLLLRTRNR